MTDLDLQTRRRDPGATPAPPRPWLGWRLGGLILIVGLSLALFSYRFFDSGPAAELALGGRVVVLPVVNGTGERAHEWVRWGLTEMIAQTLAANRGVQVVAPHRLPEVITARGLDARDPADRPRIRALGLALGAREALEVVVRRRADRYVLEVALRDAAGQARAKAVLTGSSPVEIADDLTLALAAGTTPGAVPVAMSRVLSPSPFLNRLYGMGLDQLHSAGPEVAQPYFEIILRHQPSFPAAKAQLAECARKLGDRRRSRALALEVLDEAQGRGDLHLQARSLRSLGLLAALDGRLEQASRLHSQARTIATTTGDLALRVAVVSDLARLALADRDQARAEEHFHQMLVLQQQSEDHLGRADTLIRLGSLALASGDLEGAEEMLAAARDLTRTLADPWTEMRAVASLGELAHRRGELELAEERWRGALAFCAQHGDRPRQLLLTHNLAQSLLRRGEIEAAEERYRDLVELAAEAGNESLEAVASLRLAEILLGQGYPSQARTHLNRALELDRLIDEPLALQRAIARLAYEEGNYQLAFSTQTAVRRQADGSWQEADEAMLAVYEKALAENRRLPLPGEPGKAGDG